MALRQGRGDRDPLPAAADARSVLDAVAPVADPAGSAQPKIIDFGIAKSMSAPLLQGGALTFQGTLMGTPAMPLVETTAKLSYTLRVGATLLSSSTTPPRQLACQLSWPPRLWRICALPSPLVKLFKFMAS